MDGHAADPQPVLDDQNLAAELGRLDGGTPPGRPAADNDKVVAFHVAPPRRLAVW
jgi:hypothetical protein